MESLVCFSAFNDLVGQVYYEQRPQELEFVKHRKQ